MGNCLYLINPDSLCTGFFLTATAAAKRHPSEVRSLYPISDGVEKESGLVLFLSAGLACSRALYSTVSWPEGGLILENPGQCYPNPEEVFPLRDK